ncbi:MAG: hypothetical protein HDS77_07030 [Bacteroidales bacterium]|nr:hypothetical protein [Bacteroidales bacterium]
MRALAAFAYSALLAILFFVGSVLLYTRILVFASGFWQTFVCIIGMVILLSWLSERGLEICSIPFNYLWDKKKKARIATIIPAIIVGLWAISAPLRIHMRFSTGDWILSIVWMLCNIVFFYNLVMLPLINKNMGQND